MTDAQVSRQLTAVEMRAAADALPGFLPHISEEDKCCAMYGWGCRFPVRVNYAYEQIELSAEELHWFLEDSREQGIFVPGQGDLHVEAPERRLQLHFCHESDIHVVSDSPNALAVFLSTRPYCDFGFTPDTISADRARQKWFWNRTRMTCTLDLQVDGSEWLGWVRGNGQVNEKAASKRELLDKLLTRVKSLLE